MSLFYTGENTYLDKYIQIKFIWSPFWIHLEVTSTARGDEEVATEEYTRFDSALRSSALFQYSSGLWPERFIFQAQTSRQTKRRRRPVWTWAQSCGAQSRVMRLNQVAECGGLHYLP